jgi:20S proteasome alpha/beta subunit
VTVCIGVISHPMVIVATDRMITSGDIQFEQQQPKIFTVAPNILALISGDIATQTALVDSTRATVRRAGIKTVKGVAQIFTDAYAAYCRSKAEAEVLKPLGLSSVEELMARRKWSADIVHEILRQVQRAAVHYEVATIIAGQDEFGPHLYVIDKPGMYSVHDRIGFASVGIGQRHAESQFMLAGYTPAWMLPEALYLTYVAKKRAEVAPGVGTYTDLAVITAGPTGSVTIIDRDPQFIQLLDSVYKAESDHVAQTRHTSAKFIEDGMKRIFAEVAKKTAAQSQAPPADATPSAPAEPQAEVAPPTPQAPKRGRRRRPALPE